jgi:hypothetical protein
VRERTTDTGPEYGVYKTVRVHFDYNPATKRYKQIGIVDITELPNGGTYEIYSPFVKADKRALRMGEVTLCALNSGVAKESASREITINISRGDWHEQLKRLEYLLDERERRVAHALQQV